WATSRECRASSVRKVMTCIGRQARQLLVEDSEARVRRSGDVRAQLWSPPMKSLEFEKVSVSDVRRELDREKKPVEVRNRSVDRPTQARAVLTDAASRWIAGLPPHVRPFALAQKFPRIANSIADLWRRVARCEEYLDT